jgi:uncharacterized membrane protein
MLQIFLMYIASLGTIVLLDLLWVGGIAKDFYARNLSHLFAERFMAIPIVLWYLLYAGGITLFASFPSLSSGNPVLKAGLLGTALGLITYGTYDLINHGLLKHWPTVITVVDILWGVVLSGVAAIVGVIVAKFFA